MCRFCVGSGAKPDLWYSEEKRMLELDAFDIFIHILNVIILVAVIFLIAFFMVRLVRKMKNRNL